MKALVLSGGEGSRLRPITHTNAKQLIPIANRPILFHVLDAIRDAGIADVGIVVGQTADEVMAAVGDGSVWDMTVTYVPQEAPLGLAHAVLTAGEFLGDESFVMYLGDNVVLEGITRFAREFERHGPDAQIFVARVPEPERFGVVEVDGDRVVRLVEKPMEFVSDLALVGVYLFNPSILEACESLRPSWRGEYEITEAIQWLVDRGLAVRAERLEGWWKDTGRPEDLLEANRMMLQLERHRVHGDVDPASRLEGTVVVDRCAKIVRSELIGPVVVGEGTAVEDSVIGPNASISFGCTVSGSRIEDSIVMEGCTVRDVRGLTGSILGKNVEVRRAARPGMHRVVVGDQSQLEVD